MLHIYNAIITRLLCIKTVIYLVLYQFLSCPIYTCSPHSCISLFSRRPADFSFLLLLLLSERDSEIENVKAWNCGDWNHHLFLKNKIRKHFLFRPSLETRGWFTKQQLGILVHILCAQLVFFPIVLITHKIRCRKLCCVLVICHTFLKQCMR